MFSGGEAFRIDFALRIGISQVIAKRSGASLKTLIIDEGFGALDDEGISLMMNCIYRIVNHFEKVIVVSHLPALKEMFPVHINVTKGGNGSFVSVEFRG
jgi:exonuclease SbcC